MHVYDTPSTTYQLPENGGARRPHHPLVRLAPWLAGLAFGVLYALTAAPSLVALFDDSLEFQLVLPTLAIAHPTGYPLYTLLGALWSRLLFPFGNWAWRVNLFSALAAAAAVALLFAVAQRLVRHPRTDWTIEMAAALAAAICFGFGPVWWAQATVAEVYALHNLLLAALLLVTLDAPHCQGRRFTAQMALLALLIGLGLSHHRTLLLALPGVALYLLWSVPNLWRPRRAWLLWLAALCLPLLLYLYLPLRASAGVLDLHGSYRNTWAGFWDHVLARGYSGFFSVSALTVERTPQEWLALGLAQVGWIGGVLALLGCGWLADARLRKQWLLVLLVLAVNLFFALLYRVGDQEVFLLPVFLCLALLAGGGVALLLRWLPRLGMPAGYSWLVAFALLALLAWGPGRGAWVNRSQAWQVHDYAVDMAKVDFPPGSIVLGLEGEATALKYMQAAQGLERSATAVAADDPQQRRELLAQSVAAGAPTYLTRELEGVAGDYSFSGEGPLVRAWPRGGAQVAAPPNPLSLPMAGGRLLLAGYDLQTLAWAAGPALRLALYWRPAAPLDQTLKVSLRLLDAGGSPLLYADGAPAVSDQFPLRQVAPTTAWLPEELVRDVYTLYLPPLTAAQPVTLQVILYDAATLAEAGRWETAVTGK